MIWGRAQRRLGASTARRLGAVLPAAVACLLSLWLAAVPAAAQTDAQPTCVGPTLPGTRIAWEHAYPDRVDEWQVCIQWACFQHEFGFPVCNRVDSCVSYERERLTHQGGDAGFSIPVDHLFAGFGDTEDWLFLSPTIAACGENGCSAPRRIDLCWLEGTGQTQDTFHPHGAGGETVRPAQGTHGDSRRFTRER